MTTPKTKAKKITPMDLLDVLVKTAIGLSFEFEHEKQMTALVEMILPTATLVPAKDHLQATPNIEKLKPQEILEQISFELQRNRIEEENGAIDLADMLAHLLGHIGQTVVDKEEEQGSNPTDTVTKSIKELN